jgi:hypothetical protein
VLDAALDAGGSLCFRIKLEPNGSARPEELLEALDLRDLLDTGSVLIRKNIELADDEPPSSEALAGGGFREAPIDHESGFNVAALGDRAD